MAHWAVVRRRSLLLFTVGDSGLLDTSKLLLLSADILLLFTVSADEFRTKPFLINIQSYNTKITNKLRNFERKRAISNF